MSIKERAAGAVLGALIGDALAVGPHWYYDLTQMRRDYGDWITGYTDPRPDRYHAGLKAGQPSQAGIITTAYCCVLALLVQGERRDPSVSEKLMALVTAGDLPFHAVTADQRQPPNPGDPDPPRAGRFSSPDAPARCGTWACPRPARGRYGVRRRD